MAGKKIWFGNLTHAQWVPAPATGMTVTRDGRSDELEFDNGGIYVSRSAARHLVYNVDIPVADASLYDGIEAYQRFDLGEYGSGFVRFIDPMVMDQNLAPANWAAPALAEQGWKAIYDTTPSYTTTATNSYHMPVRKAVYSITGAADAVPTKQNSVLTILIPEGHTVHVGAAGSLTGTAKIRIQPILLSGADDTVVDLTPAADTAQPAFTRTFSGSTYRAIKIYLTRTSTADSTVTFTALWIQAHPTGVTPTMTRHIPGKGHTGLRFRGNSAGENYVMTNRHLVGASFQLVEVEQWQ